MQLRRLSLLLVMNRYSRPVYAQSNAMTVVTLPPPTSVAPAAESTSTPRAGATVVPSILYPVGNPILNNIDTLIVNYITPWQTVDMIVSCGASEGDQDAFSFKADNRKRCRLEELSTKLTSDSTSKWTLRPQSRSTII